MEEHPNLRGLDFDKEVLNAWLSPSPFPRHWLFIIIGITNYLSSSVPTDIYQQYFENPDKVPKFD